MTAGVDPGLWSRGPVIATTTTGSALEVTDQRAALSQLYARGSGPSFSSSPRIRIGNRPGL
jgi:hypothetical protein